MRITRSQVGGRGWEKEERWVWNALSGTHSQGTQGQPLQGSVPTWEPPEGRESCSSSWEGTWDTCDRSCRAWSSLLTQKTPKTSLNPREAPSTSPAQLWEPPEAVPPPGLGQKLGHSVPGMLQPRDGSCPRTSSGSSSSLPQQP